MLHGIGGDKDHWTRVAPTLRARFRVIAVDLPGFGDSDRRSDKRYTARDQVAYLDAIVAALGLESFHLGGNSMGGLIATRYAAAHPAKVKSLWLLAPGGVGEGPAEMLAGLKPGEHVPLFARSPAELDTVIALATSKPPYVSGAIKEILGARAAADYDLHVRIFHELDAEWRGEPLEKAVAGLETPARIVWGEEDRLLPVVGADALHAAMPRSSVLRLPGIGHVPQLEAPQTVAEDYLEFVAGLETR